MKTIAWVLGLFLMQPVWAAATAATEEVECTDRKDNDKDGLVDCADADCYKNTSCESGQSNENSNALCSDWIDNDGDGFIDCDDPDCEGNGVTRCQGSWTGREGASSSTPLASLPPVDDLPELTGSMQIEDLLGRGGDADGERTDEVCADGIDNDGDGRMDCQDLGCRFDPAVTVCATTPGLRFSAVVFGGLELRESQQGDGNSRDPFLDASFSRIQLRALGQVPFIQNSFFLLNARAERDVRLTFAMFQVPLNKRGHYFNLNSGGGGLSSQLVQSIFRNTFGDPANFAFQFAEQRSGLALEFGGPVLDDRSVIYRTFATVGSGTRGGSIGGRFFRADGENMSYGAGGQLQINVIGAYDRWTSPMLYTPVPTTLSFYLGGRFDQRAEEQYVAGNVFGVFRTGRLHLSVEPYVKKEFIYDSLQMSYVAQANVLLWPRKLLLSAEWAQFIAGDFQKPLPFETSLVRPVDQSQVRAALHAYIFRNVFLGSLIFRQTQIAKNPDRLSDNTMERTVELEARVMF